MKESDRGREYREKQALFFDSNTTRGIEDGVDNYPSMLGFESKDKFLEWIKGKTVLDLGSGYGGVARDLKIEEETAGEKYDAKIVSMNPLFSREGFRNEADRRSILHMAAVDRISPEQWDDSKFVGRVNDAHNKYAVAGTWHDLPFADKSFDRIMATYSFPFYEKVGVDVDIDSVDKVKIGEVVREIKRVLKAGGEARLFPVKLSDKSDSSFRKAEMVAHLLLKIIDEDATLKYSLIDPAGKNSGKCLIITKLPSEVEKNRA